MEDSVKRENRAMVEVKKVTKKFKEKESCERLRYRLPICAL